jgi:phosphatidylglycerophosphate synthase
MKPGKQAEMNASDPTFSQRALAELRAGGYRPRAWGQFLARSWHQARTTAQQRPWLTAEWRGMTNELILAQGIMVALTTRHHGWHLARRTFIPGILGMALQAGDLYVHLGLHRTAQGQPLPHLGGANHLTMLRYGVAVWTTSRLIARLPLDDGELLLALLVVLGTDLADGPLARHTKLASPLGRYLDGESDLFAWTALTITQVQRGQVPAWFLGAYGFRWFVPLALGLTRTFVNSDPVALTPSWFSRLSGGSQVALAFSGMLLSRRSGQPDHSHWQRRQMWLVIGTSALLIGAGLKILTRMISRQM